MSRKKFPEISFYLVNESLILSEDVKESFSTHLIQAFVIIVTGLLFHLLWSQSLSMRWSQMGITLLWFAVLIIKERPRFQLSLIAGDISVTIFWLGVLFWIANPVAYLIWYVLIILSYPAFQLVELILNKMARESLIQRLSKIRLVEIMGEKFYFAIPDEGEEIELVAAGYSMNTSFRAAEKIPTMRVCSMGHNAFSQSLKVSGQIETTSGTLSYQSWVHGTADEEVWWGMVPSKRVRPEEVSKKFIREVVENSGRKEALIKDAVERQIQKAIRDLLRILEEAGGDKLNMDYFKGPERPIQVGLTDADGAPLPYYINQLKLELPK